jgi:hypothetical protein
MDAQSSLRHHIKVRRSWTHRCVDYLLCRIPKSTSLLGLEYAYVLGDF